MERPDFKEEKKLWQEGYNLVAGLDEAGRGPLAGPVVAAAVTVMPAHSLSMSARYLAKIFGKNFGIRDSKKISAKQRGFFYEKLTNNENIRWGVGIVSEKIIDRINILEATKLAMEKAIKNLIVTPDFLILDGNFSISLDIPQKSIVRADEKVFSCAAAGIIAKVTRDSIMDAMHKKYPLYGFNKHKGYGTALHLKKLQQLGPCKIHRKCFQPVGELLHHWMVKINFRY